MNPFEAIARAKSIPARNNLERWHNVIRLLQGESLGTDKLAALPPPSAVRPSAPQVPLPRSREDAGPFANVVNGNLTGPDRDIISTVYGPIEYTGRQPAQPADSFDSRFQGEPQSSARPMSFRSPVNPEGNVTASTDLTPYEELKVEEQTMEDKNERGPEDPRYHDDNAEEWNKQVPNMPRNAYAPEPPNPEESLPFRQVLRHSLLTDPDRLTSFLAAQPDPEEFTPGAEYSGTLGMLRNFWRDIVHSGGSILQSLGPNSAMAMDNRIPGVRPNAMGVFEPQRGATNPALPQAAGPGSIAAQGQNLYRQMTQQPGSRSNNPAPVGQRQARPTLDRELRRTPSGAFSRMPRDLDRYDEFRRPYEGARGPTWEQFKNFTPNRPPKTDKSKPKDDPEAAFTLKQADMDPNYFNVVDKTGKKHGVLDISNYGEKLYVHWAGNTSGNELPSNAGFMLPLLRQLKKLYPEAKYIEGDRASGARAKAASAWDDKRAALRRSRPDISYREIREILGKRPSTIQRVYLPED